MRSLFATLTQLVIPAGGGPSSPAVVIGGAPFPPELVTFYATEPATLVGVILKRADSTNYVYDALIIDAFGAPNQVNGKVAAGVVNEVYRIIGSGVNALEFGFRSPVPRVIFNGVGTVRFTNGHALEIGGDLVCTRNKTYSAMSVVGSRNVNTFANVPNNPSVTLTKLGGATETDLVYWFSQGCFGGAINANVEFGADAGTGTAAGGNQFFNVALTHFNVAGGNRITNLAAGAYTVNLKWRAIAGTIQTDANDRTYLHVAECAV